MKNIIKSLLAVAVLGAASAAHAISIPDTGSVTVSKTPISGTAGGGVFEAVVGAQSFYTFCVQREVTISLPGTYSYELAYETTQGMALTKATAYLFSKFALGDITVASKSASDAMQLAIWYFQGESKATDDLAGNMYISMATAALGGSAWNSVSSGAVRIMQLTRANGDDAQDQLVYVPDTGATLALLGLGLSAFAVARRRMR